MTKKELVQHMVVLHSQLPAQQVEIGVQCLLDTLVQALNAHQRIEVRGFGSFGVRLIKERHARNPRTGDAVQVKARYRPFFVAGKELKERINR